MNKNAVEHSLVVGLIVGLLLLVVILVFLSGAVPKANNLLDMIFGG